MAIEVPQGQVLAFDFSQKKNLTIRVPLKGAQRSSGPKSQSSLGVEPGCRTSPGLGFTTEVSAIDSLSLWLNSQHTAPEESHIFWITLTISNNLFFRIELLWLWVGPEAFRVNSVGALAQALTEITGLTPKEVKAMRTSHWHKFRRTSVLILHFVLLY